MARQKKPVHRVQMTDGKRNIIRQLLEEYDIETAEDIQDALKDLLGGTIKPPLCQAHHIFLIDSNGSVTRSRYICLRKNYHRKLSGTPRLSKYSFRAFSFSSSVGAVLYFVYNSLITIASSFFSSPCFI